MDLIITQPDVYESGIYQKVHIWPLWMETAAQQDAPPEGTISSYGSISMYKLGQSNTFLDAYG